MKAFILSVLLISSPVMAADEVQDLMVRCQDALRGDSHWSWSVVRVRAVLELGIKVPVLATFSVNPEVELYFTKK